MANVVVWFSRHTPTARQRAELTRLFPGSRLILDREVFRDAEDVVDRFHAAHGDEMVIVAPLSVVQALLERGIRPLWAEMEQCRLGAAEVTMPCRDGRVDYYRFVRFRRVVAVEMRFEEL
jgi:hypothetical protein